MWQSFGIPFLGSIFFFAPPPLFTLLCALGSMQIIWALSTDLLFYDFCLVLADGTSVEAWNSQFSPAGFVLLELLCDFVNRSQLLSMALSASQLQLQIFLGSGNPVIAP